RPEILLGLIPGAGGTQRPPCLVGYQVGKGRVCSGRRDGAEEAQGSGLADQVGATASLPAGALAAPPMQAERPTTALAAAEKARGRGWGQPMETALEIEAAEFANAFSTEDAREGVAAFLEKRKPTFTGR